MFTYDLIRSHRRTVSIQILPGGKVVVKAPHLAPKFFIDRFVRSKQVWIEKHLEKINYPTVSRGTDFRDGTELLFLGRTYTLKFGDYPGIKIHGQNLLVPRALQFRAKKELSAWYLSCARVHISGRVSHFAGIMGAKYHKIIFSDTSSKWGSCTSENNLQFNWRLMMAPPLVLDYVVVHELAHIFEKNHSRSFWKLVTAQKPAYRQYRKWLRDNSYRLNSIL